MRAASKQLSLLALLLTVPTPTRGQSETCGQRYSLGNCRATMDYVFVVDNSWSVADSHDTISNIMLRFIDDFDMDANDDSSPRVGCATAAAHPPGSPTRATHASRAAPFCHRPTATPPWRAQNRELQWP